MKKLFYSLLAVVLAACGSEKQAPIDREALVARNNPQVSSFDSLASLSVGNGEFAFTVDATGLQTFPLVYKKGVPLGTQSQWGWHSFGNPNKYKPEEYLKEHDFGRGHKEIYACQFKEDGRQKEASNWYRMNPHRLHLGIVGLELGDDVKTSDITDIAQTLDMWNGVINSHFTLKGNAFDVQTVCHPQMDMISASITSPARAGVKLHFPYPTGAHADDACNWDANNKHTTDIVFENAQSAVLKRTLDSTVYYVSLRWEGKASLKEKSANYFVLIPAEDKLAFSCKFTSAFPGTVFESEPAVYTSAYFRRNSGSRQQLLEQFLEEWCGCRLLTLYRPACQRTGTPCRIEPIPARDSVGRQCSAAGNRANLQFMVWQVPPRNDMVASGLAGTLGASRIAGPHTRLVRNGRTCCP